MSQGIDIKPDQAPVVYTVKGKCCCCRLVHFAIIYLSITKDPHLNEDHILLTTLVNKGSIY